MDSQKKIVIKSGSKSIKGFLNDSKTSDNIWDSLPLESSVNTWGDEIYFSIPVINEEENPQATVDLGDIGYWPPGNAICLFFGLTPISVEGEIKPASPVNIIGKMVGDMEELKLINSGDVISIRRFDQE